MYLLCTSKSSRSGADGFVFTSTTGAPLRRSVYGSTFRRAARSIGLDETSHDLRHHCASLLIRSGLSVKAIQAYLGHATAAETLDTYGHLWPDDEERIRSAIDAAFDPLADYGGLMASVEATKHLVSVYVQW